MNFRQRSPAPLPNFFLCRSSLTLAYYIVFIIYFALLNNKQKPIVSLIANTFHTPAITDHIESSEKAFSCSCSQQQSSLFFSRWCTTAARNGLPLTRAKFSSNHPTNRSEDSLRGEEAEQQAILSIVQNHG